MTSLDPGRTGQDGPDGPELGVRTVVATVSLYIALLAGGAAVGLAIAVGPGNGTVGAMIIGFLTLPVAFGASMSAWRAILATWLLGGLARSALRSRGNEERFRAEVGRSFASIRAAGPAALPGTWVFVPIAALAGLAGGVAMLLVAGEGRLTAGALLFAAASGLGLLLRRLAKAGRLPIPEE